MYFEMERQKGGGGERAVGLLEIGSGTCKRQQLLTSTSSDQITLHSVHLDI